MSPDAKAFLDDYLGRVKPALAAGPEFVKKAETTRGLWLACRDRGGRVLFMGNGGSSGIASHLSIDLAKNAKVPSLCFSDAAQITCLANDYGFENWMARALTMSATKSD